MKYTELLQRSFFFAALLIPVIHVNAQVNNRLDAIHAIQLGDNLLRLGNSEQALLAYTNAIKMDITFADTYMKRATLLSRLGQNLPVSYTHLTLPTSDLV